MNTLLAIAGILISVGFGILLYQNLPRSLELFDILVPILFAILIYFLLAPF